LDPAADSRNFVLCPGGAYDRSARDRRVFYAFGHGHLGLTQAAGTAQLVSELVGGMAPSIDTSAFSARRF
jgi:D-amino-acid dehydrogenase